VEKLETCAYPWRYEPDHLFYVVPILDPSTGEVTLRIGIEVNLFGCIAIRGRIDISVPQMTWIIVSRCLISLLTRNLAFLHLVLPW